MSFFQKQLDSLRERMRKLLEQAGEAFKVISRTPKAIKLVWEAHAAHATFMLISNILIGIFPLANLWLIKMLTDEISRAAGVHLPETLGNWNVPTLVHNLANVQFAHLLGWICVIHILEGIVQQAAGYFEHQLSEHLSLMMNERILRKANSFADLSLFESPKYYDALQKAEREAYYRPMSIVRQSISVFRAVVQFAVMTTSFFIFQPLLALFVVSFTLPHMYLRIKQDHENYKQESWQTPEVRQLGYFQRILTQDYYAKEIRLFGLADFFLNSYLEKNKEYFHRRTKIRRKQVFQNLLLSTLASVVQAGAYALIAFQAAVGTITLGAFTFYTSALAQLEGQLMSIVWSLSSLYENNLYLNNLFEFMDMEPTMVLADPVWAVSAPRPIKEGIEFRNVSFVYPGNDKKVFDDLSFTIKSGQCVALVGENGAGKTTIVKLIGRLYDPTSGAVLVDGINLREMDIESWRQDIAIIFQDYNQYYLTARENIGLGQVNFIDDEIRVKRAAEKSGAHAVIQKLPKGYENMLGYYYREDDGANLSGGEWQKVALGRSFMRSPDPGEAGSDRAAQILILDEPTASLDVQSEHDIYVRFKELTRGKTTVLISHRFSTVKMADRILLLDDGKIVEDGSHEELMALNGSYAELFKMQADKYL